GARQLVFARLSSFEPDQNRPARDGILSKPQIRQVKTVNHISRRKMNTHDLIDRDMQIIVELHVVVRAQFAVRPGISYLPVKLFPRHAKFVVAIWRVAFHPGPRRHAHEGKRDEDCRGNNGPDDLKRCVAVGVGGAPTFTVTVLDQTTDHQNRDQNKRDTRNIINKVEQRVDVLTKCGYILWQPAQHLANHPSLNTMTFRIRSENFTFANTAITPIQAQTPLICKGFVPMLIRTLPANASFQNHDLLVYAEFVFPPRRTCPMAGRDRIFSHRLRPCGP